MFFIVSAVNIRKLRLEWNQNETLFSYKTRIFWDKGLKVTVVN